MGNDGILLGCDSYALAPIVLMSMVLLAHSKTHGLSVAQSLSEEEITRHHGR